MRRIIFFLLSIPLCLSAQPQLHGITKQRHFKTDVPPGNYSGIAYLGDSLYAVVSDKSPQDGFFLFRLHINLKSGKLHRVDNLGFFGSGRDGRDAEGIAYFPGRRTLLVCGEKDNRILEHTLSGQHTGREVALPPVFSGTRSNCGLESITFQPADTTFWVTTEATLKADGDISAPNHPVKNRLRLLAIDSLLRPKAQYAYQMDAPKAHRKAARYAMGVSELLALPDGYLLVLEREVYVPKKKLGAFARCKLYVVNPSEGEPIDENEPLSDASPYLQKTLFCEWRTRLTLLGRKFANYEGMCLGPRLENGAHAIVLMSDSQNQYHGVLRDWFKILVVQ
ncbi:MAG: esterase-like activity of phytase family protein [Prevotella sp.]|nr:esterase-like activity of phytase family protein [Prevotella sp.]